MFATKTGTPPPRSNFRRQVWGDLAGFSDGVPVNVVQRGVLLTFSLTAEPDHDVPEGTNGGDQADDQEI